MGRVVADRGGVSTERAEAVEAGECVWQKLSVGMHENLMEVYCPRDTGQCPPRTFVIILTMASHGQRPGLLFHPTVHKTAPTTENDQAKISSAEVGEPCLGE